MKNEYRGVIIFGLITGIYFAIRLPLLTVQNAYLDYDEGTYLMFARLIMHGVLPYRDIFAVHPPLYYYTLAAWMWAFGDNYVVGRSLSLILGFLSIIVAYLTGKELRNEKLGLAFALVIALDPMAVKLNTLVLHGSMIELFTLLSLWALVRYIKTEKIKFAYAALALASIGSAAKFTIIPYLVALYVFILFNQSKSLKNYLLKVTNRILTAEQGKIVIVTYLLWSGIVVAIGVLIPTTFVRIVAIIPGLHGIDKIGQVYTSAAFLFFWLGITVYLFKISYVREIPNFLKELAKSVKAAILLASVVIISKALIEVPLGVMVSGNYIQQTYVDQSGRGFPFMGIFWFFHSVLATLQSDKPDSAAYVLPAILLIAFLLILKQLGEQTGTQKELKAFLLLNIVFYLVVIPIIPDVRMIYSMFLLFYLIALYPLASMGRKQASAVVIMALILLSVNAGIDLNYPRGKLAISSTPHIKEFRDDLGSYIHSNDLNGTYLSINPMDAYYLHLHTIPYMIDTFGLGYLRGENLVELINEYSPNYMIIDTWMFNIMKRAKVLFNVYNPVLQYAIKNGTILFAESNSRGECVELFRIRGDKTKWNMNIHRAQIELYYNGTKILSIIPRLNDQYVVLKLESLKDGYYKITLTTSKKTYSGDLQLNGTTATLDIPKMGWELQFSGVPMNNYTPVFNGNLSSIQLCTPKMCLAGRGNFMVKKGKVFSKGPLELTVEKSSN